MLVISLLVLRHCQDEEVIQLLDLRSQRKHMMSLCLPSRLLTVRKKVMIKLLIIIKLVTILSVCTLS